MATRRCPIYAARRRSRNTARSPDLEQLPLWGFDGSSTKQAEGHSSDCVLKPVAVYPDPARINGALIMCEVVPDGKTPHPTNKRADFSNERRCMVRLRAGILSARKADPLAGFPAAGYPAPQGPYYTGVGY